MINYFSKKKNPSGVEALLPLWCAAAFLWWQIPTTACRASLKTSEVQDLGQGFVQNCFMCFIETWNDLRLWYFLLEFIRTFVFLKLDKSCWRRLCELEHTVSDWVMAAAQPYSHHRSTLCKNGGRAHLTHHSMEAYMSHLMDACGVFFYL